MTGKYWMKLKVPLRPDMRWLTCTILFLTLSFNDHAQKLSLHEEHISLKRGLSFKLQIPAGYHISVAIEGLKRPRFFSKSPDGKLFITDMYDRSDNKRGRVLLLDGWNDKTKSFSTAITFLDKLHNPNQILFYSANGKHYLYVAETDKLSRFEYTPGDTIPSSSAKVITTFPDYGLNYKYGGILHEALLFTTIKYM